MADKARLKLGWRRFSGSHSQAAALLVFVMLAPALALMLTMQSGTVLANPGSDNWWDTDWGKRRTITIGPLNPENYQVEIVLPFYDNSIRFLENENVQSLPYWIENYTDDNMTVWVRRLENSDSTIHVYYDGDTGNVENFDNTMTKDFGEGGLKLLFHMDEGSGVTAYDDNTASGDDNGTLVSAVTWVGSDGGQWDNRSVTFSGNDSLDFAGVNDYITVPSSASLDIDGSLTLEAWVKLDNVSGNRQIFAKRSGEAGFYLYIGSGKPTFMVASTSFGGAGGTAQSPNALTTGEWYHAVGTFDDDNDQLTVYIDGVQENYSIYPDGLDSPLTTLYIGVQDSIANDLDGQLDDLRIYDRCLTDAEILCHYERRKFYSPEPTVTIGAEETEVAAPGKPVLVSPENQHSTSDNTPTFAWENGSDATSHRLVIDNSQGFDDGENIYDNASAWDNSGTAIENELPADNYWWRVCAVNAQGDNWSENTWTFEVTVAGEEYERSIEQGFSLTELAPRGAEFGRVIEQGFSIGAAVGMVMVVCRLLSQAFGFTGAVGVTSEWRRGLTQDFSLTGSITAEVSFVGELSEELSFTDAIAVKGEYGRSLSGDFSFDATVGVAVQRVARELERDVAQGFSFEGAIIAHEYGDIYVTSPWCDDRANPIDVVVDPTFSAIYTVTDNNIPNPAQFIQIQVGTSLNDNDLWDNIATVTVENGQRSPDVSYDGTPLTLNSTYWWRCRLGDSNGNLTEWTSPQTFGYQEAPFDLVAAAMFIFPIVLMVIAFAFDNVVFASFAGIVFILSGLFFVDVIWLAIIFVGVGIYLLIAAFLSEED